MKLQYSILRCGPEDNVEEHGVRVIDRRPNRGAALRRAKKLSLADERKNPGWACRYFIAILEEV